MLGFIITVLFILWHILVSEKIPVAIERAIYKSNLPFWFDLWRTRARRKKTRIVKASRGVRRESARQLAKSFYYSSKYGGR